MKRLKLERTPWHVTLRGSRRMAILRDDEDHEVFRHLLKESYQNSGAEPITGCELTNHLHVVPVATSQELTALMRRVDRAYSGYHNDKYKLSGHAFEQEYYCKPVVGPFYLQRVVRYVHLNPIRAGFKGRPEDYPWSNAAQFLRGGGDYLGSNDALVLSTFDPDLAKARKIYRNFVEEDLHRPLIPIVGKNPASEIWQEQFRWLWEWADKHHADLAPMDPLRVAVYLAVRAGVPPRAIGLALNHSDGRQASQMAYRMGLLLQAQPLFQVRLDRLGLS